MDYLVQKQYWVSFCAAGLAGFVQRLSGSENYRKSLFVFFSTLVIYNLNRTLRWYVHGSENKWQVPVWKRIREAPHVFLVGVTGVAVLLFNMPLYAVYALAPAFIFGFFYTMPLYYAKAKYISLRRVKGVKIFLIAISWGLAIGVFPLENYSSGWQSFSLISLFVIGIGIPFDIRDLVCDPPQLKTLPQLLGKTKAKAIALLCLSGSYIFLCALNPLLVYKLAYAVSLSVTGLLICRSSIQKPNFYYSFWVEGCSLLPLLLSLVFGLWV